MKLKPIVVKDTWALELEEEVRRILFSFYGPLYEVIGDEKRNERSALQDAILAGTIVYTAATFKGKFSARISSELQALGAEFRMGGWFLPVLTPRLRQLVMEAQRERDDFFKKIITALQTILPMSIVAMALPGIYKKIVEKVSKAFEATVGEKPLPPVKEEEAKVFIDSVESSIRGFTDDETAALREMVAVARVEDWPKAKLIEKIAARPGISKERAKFIAWQEVSLATTAIKGRYYIASGMPKYEWRTRHDSLVRSDHAALDGGIFAWSDPPIVNASKGYRRHPGEDYNCRCEAIPILEGLG